MTRVALHGRGTRVASVVGRGPHVSSDDNLVRYQAPYGASALTRSWHDKGRELVSASDWDSDDLNTAIAALKSEGEAQGNRKGYALVIPQGRLFEISTPAVLPRNGSTPTDIVHIVGEHIRTSIIQGADDFPTNRALIEWAAETSQAWHQRISNLTLRLPNVAGTKAIHYEMHGADPATAERTDYQAERLQLDLRDILIECNNQYHEVLCDLEGSIWWSDFRRVWGDPSPGTTQTYDTLLFRFSYLEDGGTPTYNDDTPGFAYSVMENCASALRRGGWDHLLEGRTLQSDINRTWTNSGRSGSGYWFRNSAKTRIGLIGAEGRNDPDGRVVFTNCWDMQVGQTEIGLGSSQIDDWAATTAYAVGDLVQPADVATTNHRFVCTTAGTSGASEPSWDTGDGNTTADNTAVWTEDGPAFGNAINVIGGGNITIDLMAKTPGNARWSTTNGNKHISIDDTATRVLVREAQIPMGVAATTAPDTELEILGTDALFNHVTARIISANSATLTGLTWQYGNDPNAPGGTKTWDVGSLADGASASTTVDVAGAVQGDPAYASLSTIAASGWVLVANVTGANTVTVDITNNTGDTVDLASGTLNVRVAKAVR